MLGKTDIEMKVGYTADAKYANKETRYKSSFLKRFFGKVKVGRSTNTFNLKENTLSEVDWENAYIYTYPLASISDPEWHKKRAPFSKERETFAKERYIVKDPEILFEFYDAPEHVAGYTTRKVDIQLNLLTIDKKKNAQSITHITQSLWLTDAVKGFDLYNQFNRQLALKTGVHQHRLGVLGDLLSNYPNDLRAIENDLSKIKGYVVKSHLLIRGSYIQNRKDKPSKKSTLILKDETMTLTGVQTMAALDRSAFQPPRTFTVKTIK